MTIEQIKRFFKAYGFPIEAFKDEKGNIRVGNKQFGVSYEDDDMWFDGFCVTGQEIIYHQKINLNNLHEMIILGFELTKDIIEEMNNI